MEETTSFKEAKTEDKVKIEVDKAISKEMVKAMVKEADKDTAKVMDKTTLAILKEVITYKPLIKVITTKATIRITQMEITMDKEAIMAKAETVYRAKPLKMMKMNGQCMA